MTYLRWLLRIVTWDGLLPCCVIAVTLVVKLMFPHVRGALEMTAIVLPISAFLLRAAVGSRQIAANQHGQILRISQYTAFGIALLLLVLIDCVLILSQIMPAGALWAAKQDRVVWAVLFSLYIGLMTFALFPGRIANENRDR